MIGKGAVEPVSSFSSSVILAAGGALTPSDTGFYVDAVKSRGTSGTLGLYFDSTTKEIYAATEATRRLQEDDESRIAALEAEVAELKRLLTEQLGAK